MMTALIEAGGDPDTLLTNGNTPSFYAAANGQVDAVKVLLRARAHPPLSGRAVPPGDVRTPLDAAAKHGQLQVVFELILQLGIEGCGGAS